MTTNLPLAIWHDTSDDTASPLFAAPDGYHRKRPNGGVMVYDTTPVYWDSLDLPHRLSDPLRQEEIGIMSLMLSGRCLNRRLPETTFLLLRESR